MNELSGIQQFSVWVLPVLFAITVHEVAHGWVALRFGDRTAQLAGRLTLNPLKHIDPIGTILVPTVLLMLGGIVFGWAKPVPIGWHNLKNPKRDMAVVALAGPFANLIMALFWGYLAKLSITFIDSWGVAAMALFYMGQAGVVINLLLMIFNLIPIPPLDGSRVVSGFLSPALGYQYNRLEPYGFFILLALLFSGVLSFLIGPAMNFAMGTLMNLIGLNLVP